MTSFVSQKCTHPFSLVYYIIFYYLINNCIVVINIFVVEKSFDCFGTRGICRSFGTTGSFQKSSSDQDFLSEAILFLVLHWPSFMSKIV